jgi:hypothetical protein
VQVIRVSRHFSGAFLQFPLWRTTDWTSQPCGLANTAQFGGVVVDEANGLVYASDMNSGLWILRRTDH